MYRRDFLNAMGVSAGVPFSQLSGTSKAEEWVGNDVTNRIVQVASSLAEMGIDGTMETFVEMSHEIAPAYLDSSDLFPSNLATTSDTESVLSNNYEAIKSMMETLDRSLGLNIASRPFAMITYASKIGGILLALGIVGQTAVPLHRANTKQGLEPEKIDVEKHKKFGFAVLGLCIELSLFVVPFNYRIAWRGTRYFSNRVLFRVQRHLPTDIGRLVHTMLMIVTHWFQRMGLEITQNRLYEVSGALEYGVNYLQSTSQELEFDSRFKPKNLGNDLIWKPSAEDFIGLVEELLQNFSVFAEFIGDPLLNELEIEIPQ